MCICVCVCGGGEASATVVVQPLNFPRICVLRYVIVILTVMCIIIRLFLFYEFMILVNFLEDGCHCVTNMGD